MSKVSKPDMLTEIRRKLAVLQLWHKAYHVDDDPIVSDAIYDDLLQEIRQDIEDGKFSPDLFPEFVGGTLPVGGSAGTYAHKVNMLGLKDVWEDTELKRWLTIIVGYTPLMLATSRKIDGLAISLTYENGTLVSALTRGNGYTGEDVTNNALNVIGISRKLFGDNLPNTIIIRGEVYIPKESLEKRNRELIAELSKPLSNPRNAAAGALRAHTADEVVKRGCSFLAYDALFPNTDDAAYRNYGYTERMAYVGKLIGSEFVVEVKNVEPTFRDVSALLKEYDAERSSGQLLYDTDGVVIRVDDKEYEEHLGVGTNYPKYAIAFKFKEEEKETKITGITCQVGMHGDVTPVGNIEPVRLGGVLVSNVTLHNFDTVEKAGLCYGDTIIIKRSGEVIPYFVGVKSRNGGDKILTPTYCPSCSSELDHDYCGNDKCKGRLSRYINHVASKAALDINGIGDKVSSLLVNGDVVDGILGLLNLNVADLVDNSIVGHKDAVKICNSINASVVRSKEHSLLYALAIPSVGISTAKRLLKAFGSIIAIANASQEKLTAINDVGPCTALCIIDYFSKNRAMVEDVVSMFTFTETLSSDVGVGVSVELIERLAGIDITKEHLDGKNVVVSGSFDFATASDVAATLESLGCNVQSGVSSKTDILFTGHKPSANKVEKANKYDCVTIVLI